jgi:hypothetical protein
VAADRRPRALTLIAGGALAGAIATGPMSAVMLAAKRAGLMGKMPPEKITDRLLDRIGWGSRSKETQDVLASLLHVGFGAAAGSVFSAVERGLRLPGPPVLLGMLFGAGVRLVSYRGWVPALGIMPPPERDRPGRPQSMLVAHLVCGAALGLLVGRPRGIRRPFAPK